MKNLKKVLALVLAFACAFTMFAGAAFTDAADIQQTEAVEMLSALGVINGYTDGSFKPNDTISRAEAAKMIYTIWNGGNDNASAFAGKSVFTDVYSGHWAEGYINFCYTNGIINGKGNSKFAPDDKVTGTELAKMLLICMGYQADKSGLTGTGYTQRTNALASQNGLYDEVTAAVGEAMPRQFAAQIMYNALGADTVKWSTDANAYEKVTTTVMLGTPNGDGTFTFQTTVVNETMGKKCMDLVTTKDVLLTKVEKEDARDTYALYMNGSNKASYTRVVNDYTNLVGQNVNVMYKDNDTTKVYGVYANEDSKVVATGYVGQLAAGSSASKIKLAGTEYNLDGTNATNMVYELNRDVNTVAASTLSSKVINDGANGRTRNAAAGEIKLVDNTGNGKVDTVVFTPVEVGKVTAVTKTSVTIDNGVGTVKFADDTIYDGIAKGDYVRVISSDNTTEGGNHVEKLDVVNAKVEGERSGSNEVKVDGTWYKLAYDGASYVTATTGTTYNLVIVGNTVLYADETEGSIANVAFVSATDPPATVLGTSNKTVKARMYFADGTDATVTISKEAGTKLTGDVTFADNTMVTYTKLSDNTYDVEKLSATNKAGCKTFVPSGSIASGATSTYYDSKISGVSIADDAVIFVKTDADMGGGKTETKVLTGAQVKSWDKEIKDASNVVVAFNTSYLTDESNGIDYIKAATLVTNSDISVPGAADTSYAYAVTDQYTTTSTPNGEKKIAVEAWNGTETVTLYADGLSFGTTISAGKLFSYRVNGSYIEGVTVATSEAAVLGFDGKAEGEIKIQDAGVAADKTYTLAKDCVVLTVDDAKTAGMAGAGLDSIVEAGYNTAGTKRLVNISYLLDSDGKIAVIVIDAENNKMDPETVAGV